MSPLAVTLVCGRNIWLTGLSLGLWLGYILSRFVDDRVLVGGSRLVCMLKLRRVVVAVLLTVVTPRLVRRWVLRFCRLNCLWTVCIVPTSANVTYRQWLDLTFLTVCLTRRGACGGLISTAGILMGIVLNSCSRVDSLLVRLPACGISIC